MPNKCFSAHREAHHVRFPTLIDRFESYLNFKVDWRILSVDYRDENLIKLYISILKNIEGANTGLGQAENVEQV